MRVRKARCVAQKHPRDDQADSRIRKLCHLSDIFQTAAFRNVHSSKKKEDKVHLERRISPYLTPTTALVRPLYTHLALPSAIHRELMMPQSGRLRLYGERAGDTAREGGVEG